MIPKTEILANKGFDFFKCSLSDTLVAYVVDENNYIPLDPIFHETAWIGDLKSLMVTSTPKFIQKELNDIFNSGSINWSIKMSKKNFTLLPHREFITLDLHCDAEEDYPSLLTALIWVNTTPFEGRDFVYGSVKNPSSSIKRYPWDSPELIQLGSFHPETGAGVFMDRTNPCWYHGVTQMLTDSKVVTITGAIPLGNQ